VPNSIFLTYLTQSSYSKFLIVIAPAFLYLLLNYRKTPGGKKGGKKAKPVFGPDGKPTKRTLNRISHEVEKQCSQAKVNIRKHFLVLS
jgi:hypothetical protein